MPRATLIHNATAGDGRPSGGELRELAQRNGYEPRYATTEDDIDAALQDPGDLVVVAGGDGTVGEVAYRLLGSDVPITILPVGTANNLALSLGIDGPIDRLVAAWKDGVIRPLNFGLVRGPWGERPMVESCGLGVFAHAMPILSALKKGGEGPPTREAVVRQDRDSLRRLLAQFVPRPLRLLLDGDPVDGDFLMVEIMNGPMLGPRLRLCAEADPGDGRFEVVLVTDAERETVLRWLERDAESDPRLPCRSATRVELEWDGDPIHIDGETWAGEHAALVSVNTLPITAPVPVSVEIAPATIPLLIPRRAARGAAV
jgi:diacylglycerol kinase (ATP)